MAGMTSAAPLPPLPSRFWADLSTRDFAALQSIGQAAQVVAVLPVAAVEQHGPHLPCAVDTVISTGVVGHALARLPASVAAIGTMAVPVIGVVASAVALGEPLGAAQIAGLIFTLAAVALATR